MIFQTEVECVEVTQMYLKGHAIAIGLILHLTMFCHHINHQCVMAEGWIVKLKIILKLEFGGREQIQLLILHY